MLRCLLRLACLGAASLGAYLPYHSPHVDFDALVGGYRTSGGATLFFPVAELGPHLFFSQGTIGRFHESWVGDVGVGYRLQTAPNFGWGINGFFDYAYSEVSNLNWFGGGGGLELVSNHWEVRFNGYATSQGRRVYRRTIQTSSEQAVIDNRPVVIAQLRDTRFIEVGRWGFDGEAGAGFCFGPGSVWGYAGYFWFNAKGVQVIQGPRLRAEYKLPIPMRWGTPEIWLGAVWQHDEVHGHSAAGTVHVQVPLYGHRWMRRRCPNLCTFKRMGDSVRRQNGPLLDQVRQVRVAGRTTGLWFIQQGATGVGTQLDPTSLTNANTNSLPGDFIFPLGPQPIDINAALGTAYSLKQNQTLVSFGNETQVTLDINGAPFVVNDITGSGRGTLVQPNAALSGVVVNDNTLIQGIGENGGLVGISGSGRTNLRLIDVLMTEQGGTFVNSPIALVDMYGNVSIEQSNLTFTSPNGIVLAKSAGAPVSYLVTGNTLSSTGGSTGGIVTSYSNATTTSTTISNNTLTNFATSGIALIHAGTGGQFTHLVTGNRVNTTGAGGPAISLNSDATLIGARIAFRLSGNTVDTAPGGGIGLNFTTGAGASTNIQGAVTQANGINAAGAAAVPAMTLTHNFANAGDVGTYLIDDTRFQGSANVSFGSTHTGNGTLNLTLANSTDTTPQGGAGTAVYAVTESSAGTTCATIAGNNTTRAKSTTAADRNIQLTQTAGTFNVTDLAGVPASNNGLTTNVVGTVTSVTTPCPTPVTP